MLTKPKKKKEKPNPKPQTKRKNKETQKKQKKTFFSGRICERDSGLFCVVWIE
jgi:hypothetical protein